MKPWMNTVNKLRSLGYVLALSNGKLIYTYQGEEPPSRDHVTPLIEVLKTHKGEITSDPYFLIDLTIREIDEVWTSGTLEWVKRARPSEWERMLIVEGEINRLALKKDADGLRETLRNYKELMISMVRISVAPKRETKNLVRQGTGVSEKDPH